MGGILSNLLCFILLHQPIDLFGDFREIELRLLHQQALVDVANLLPQLVRVPLQEHLPHELPHLVPILLLHL